MSLFPLHRPSFPCFDNEGYQEVEVFENQIHGLFGWKADHAKFTDETGIIVAPFKYLQHMSCPSGYRWVTDWMINRDYTKMDSDGWSYATSFPRLSARLREEKSVARPSPRQSCRRRLWFRIVKPSVLYSYGSVPAAVVTPPIHVCRVYENQHFSFTQGGWCTYSFTIARYADAKIESAVEYKSLDAIECDKGFVWAMDWNKDKYYTDMGKGGWSYGTSPDRIVDKYHQRKSSPAPTTRHMYRRRLWYRTMRPLEPTDGPVVGNLKPVVAVGECSGGREGGRYYEVVVWYDI